MGYWLQRRCKVPSKGTLTHLRLMTKQELLSWAVKNKAASEGESINMETYITQSSVLSEGSTNLVKGVPPKESKTMQGSFRGLY